MARRSKGFSLVSLAMAAAGAVACAPEDGAPSVQRSQGALAPGDRGDLDILFMVDNSSSMTPLQMKMLTQDPSFMTVLAGFPNGLPNIHVAVVSSDMGAPGDSASSIGCSPAGDNGVFRSTPRGTCTNTTLTSGSTFISNVGGQANYTGNLPDVFSCIAQLGSTGCGFEHQLAAVARALGADGAAPPPENAGFLRPNAELAIVMLTNEDDCSAKPNSTLFSLNGGMQSITNPLGPIANYRCNQFGHLCKNPLSATPNALISPPLNPPASSTTPPSMTLTDCESNDTSTGMLTSVADLIAGIRALKARPDDQIVVGAISPPKTPYTAIWVPASAPPPGTSGELWPQIQHSCGAAGDTNVNPAATQHTTDGSFGDPGVRIAQWVQGFGANGVVASICDADYGIAFQAIADKIQAHLQPSTSTGAGGAGGAAASGAAGTNGGVAGAGGHAGSMGVAGASGSAGQSGGVAGSSGTAGMSGATGVAGTSGTGTAGSTGSAGHAGAAGNSGSTGTAGNSGAAGQGAGGGSTGTAGNSGATGGGGNTAGGGANGSTGGSAGAGTGHTGGAGGTTTATGAGGASAGASGTGAGGQAGSTVATGTAGHVGTGGHAGATGGTGGPSNASSDGCSCETAGSPAGGWNLTLLVGALGLVISRRSSRRSSRRA